MTVKPRLYARFIFTLIFSCLFLSSAYAYRSVTLFNIFRRGSMAAWD